MEVFYPIFKDVQNLRNSHYKDKFPTVPFPNKPKPPHQGKEYRHRLEEVFIRKYQLKILYTDNLQKGGFTRLYDPDGYRIKVRCVAVWDTVGSLGM